MREGGFAGRQEVVEACKTSDSGVRDWRGELER